MTITEKIIDKIKRNRISTSEVSDCLGKIGVIEDVLPINKGHFRVAPIFWTYASHETNWDFHEQIRTAKEGHILFVETMEWRSRAVFGSLVSKFLLLYRQLDGIVVAGKLRDIPHLIKENWPIWYKGPTPVGCFNAKSTHQIDPRIIEERRKHYEGAFAVCDDSGVVIVEKAFHTEDFLKKLDEIEEQEDIWFDCIDRLKWDTFKTVCLKDYQKNK